MFPTKNVSESAGCLLLEEIMVVSETETVREIFDALAKRAKLLKNINYIYVVNDTESRKLVGILSIKELFQANKDTVIKKIMKTDVITVSPDTDREVVARLAVDNSIKSVPVCDNDILLGIVESDDIFQILHDEADEDMVRIAGIGTQSPNTIIFDTSVIWKQIYARLPWLVLGLFGGLLAAVAVNQYEEILEQELLVAAFIPLVVYLADAIGSQIQIIFIRALSMRPDLSVVTYVVREFFVNLSVGFVLAIILAIITWFWFATLSIAVVLLITVFATAFTAFCISISLPLLLKFLGKDPALGSGPLATVCIDIISLLIYFMVASYVLLV